MPGDPSQRIARRVSSLVPEMVELLRELVRIPTVNPPGDAYEPFADRIAAAYRSCGYDVARIVADDHPDHSAKYPRVNVVARRRGPREHPCLHFSGHLDVVPAGNGWTVDPFGGFVRDGKVYGRGTCDMKAGIVASLFAIEALRREGIELGGTVEQSATVDEESGGFAGVAYLAERRILSAERQDLVVLTEPLDPDRVCIGHRGVYWFDVVTHGRTAHGSMPFLGENAIDRMTEVLRALNERLRPLLETRTTRLPIVPPGARRATLNVNSIVGGQDVRLPQSPCVPDRCTAVFDRRFLPEESLDDVRDEIAAIVAQTGVPHEIVERMVVHPTVTRDDAPLVREVRAAIESVWHRPGEIVASPGTYDHKHVARIAGIEQTIAYGPGRLELAHQPDEHVAIEDLERAALVMALSAVRLLGVA